MNKTWCLPVAIRRLPCRTALSTCVQRKRSAPFISANVIQKYSLLTQTSLSHAWYVVRNSCMFPRQVSVTVVRFESYQTLSIIFSKLHHTRHEDTLNGPRVLTGGQTDTKIQDTVKACSCNGTARDRNFLRYIHVPFNTGTWRLAVGWDSRYSDSLRARRSGDRIPVGLRFSAPVQTGSGAHPASYTIGRPGLYRRAKRPGRGVDHPPHLAPMLKKE
jgi:hypothetical protein